jgi:GT2 family glycosyltransferase
MASPLVSLIVLNWNGESLIEECVNSLKKLEYANTEIIVVDNASTDSSLQKLGALSNITIVRNATNLGYAGGNNIGFGVAHGAYVATINNDITVEPSWLTELVALLESDDRIGIISGRQMNYLRRDTIDALYSYIHPSLIFFQEAFRKRYDAATADDQPLQVLGVSGASTLFRKRMLEELDGFDETLYAYHEESDLCMRAFLAGWKCVYVPSAVAFHKRSVTFNRIKGTMFYFQTRNRLWFIYKYSPLSLIFKNLFWIVFTELRILRVVVFRERVFSSYFKGLLDGFKGMSRLGAIRHSNMKRLGGKMKDYMLLVKRKFTILPKS